MRKVFWIVAALAALLALVAGGSGLAALAEAERLRNPGSAALSATLLAVAERAALLALAAAGFASLLARLDAILGALHKRPQAPEAAATPPRPLADTSYRHPVRQDDHRPLFRRGQDDGHG